jgi:hypothetical protein
MSDAAAARARQRAALALVLARGVGAPEGLAGASAVLAAVDAAEAAAAAAPFAVRADDPDRFFPTPFSGFALGGRLPPPLHPDLGVEPPPDWSPVFVAGVGRSGTTLVGRCLAAGGAKVVFLNEPRALLLAALPELDVWHAAPHASLRPRRPAAAALGALRRLLFAELAACAARRLQALSPGPVAPAAAARACVLVTKLPEHVFHVALLRAAIPAARVLHVARAPHAVAASVAAFSPAAWYGHVGGLPKWRALRALAQQEAVDDGGEVHAGGGSGTGAEGGGGGGGGSEAVVGARARLRSVCRALAAWPGWTAAAPGPRMRTRALVEWTLGAAAVAADSATYAGAVVDVQFEALVRRPDETWAAACAALGLLANEGVDDDRRRVSGGGGGVDECVSDVGARVGAFSVRELVEAYGGDGARARAAAAAASEAAAVQWRAMRASLDPRRASPRARRAVQGAEGDAAATEAEVEAEVEEAEEAALPPLVRAWVAAGEAAAAAAAATAAES